MARPGRSRPSVVRPLSLLVAAALALAGCGAGERMQPEFEGIAGARIRFAISLQPDEARAVAELVKRFEARTKTGVSVDLFTRFRDQSGATVTLERVESGGMKDLLRREGSRIHLFAQDNGDLADLLDEKLVQDVRDIRIPAAVSPSMRLSPNPDGSVWFVPFRPNVRLSYANRAAFPRAGVNPPNTVDELEQVAGRLKEQDDDRRPRVTLSLSEADGGAPTAVTIAELVLAHGGDPRRLDDPGSVAAFTFLRRMFQSDLLARESLIAKHDTEIDYLKAGEVALAQNWPVTSASLEKAGKLEDFEVHKGWQRRHVVGGDVLGIPRGVDGEEREAAVALARFLMSREAQAFLVDRNAWPAIRNDAYERLTDTVRAAREALENGWYRPTARYWAGVTEAMNEAVDRIVFRGESPEAVMAELHARVAQKYPDYPSSQ